MTVESSGEDVRTELKKRGQSLASEDSSPRDGKSIVVTTGPIRPICKGAGVFENHGITWEYL